MPLRQINYPLYIGAILTVLLVAVAIVGPSLAPYDPLQEMGVITGPDGLKYGPPNLNRPLPPFRDPRFPLGLDETSRDVASRLLTAVRPTLLLCCLIMAARISIGVLVGLIAGWFHRRVGPLVDILISVCVGVPLLIVAIATITALGIQRGVISFVVALTLTGWCETALLVKNQTRTIFEAPYIESARAIGRGAWGVLWQHVLPQLRSVLPMLMAFELSAVLLVVAELGYLNYYVGGGSVFVYRTSDTGPPSHLLIPGYPELGQMLSNFFRQLYRTPWVSLFAGLAVALMLAAFTLLGEGLRRRLDVTQAQPINRRWWFSRTGAETQSAEAWVRSGGGGIGRQRRRWPLGRAAVAVAVIAVGIGAYREFVARPAATVPRSGAAASGGQAGASTSATPTLVAVSSVPVPTEQLDESALTARLFQPGDLPKGYTLEEVDRRAPYRFTLGPPPAEAITAQINYNGLNHGRVTVVIYNTTNERDKAYQAVVKEAASDVPQVTIGEKSMVFSGGMRETDPRTRIRSYLNGYVIWARCGAVGHIEFPGADPGDPSAMAEVEPQIEYMRRLDARLASVICQPQ